MRSATCAPGQVLPPARSPRVPSGSVSWVRPLLMLSGSSLGSMSPGWRTARLWSWLTRAKLSSVSRSSGCRRSWRAWASPPGFAGP
eukprot:686623-Alexandrium_andersonii.AAC.1